MKRTDRISALVLLSVSIYFFIESEKFSPLSRLFPRVVLIILAGLAALLFILSFRRKKEGEAFDSAAFRHIPSLMALALMVAWGLLIPVLGFLVTSLIFFPAITVYLDRAAPRRKKLGRIALAAAVTVVFYFFFTKVLYVPFPEGLLL
jgi:4-amino-4-deoxy-L-arabinose transferase-like glycosyltransferase